MTTRYGSARSTSNGSSPNPGRIRSRNWSENSSEKSSAPNTPRPIRQRPKMTSATHPHQRPPDHQREVARPTDVDPGRVGRLGVVPHGPDLQSEAGSLEHPPRE